MAKKDKKCPGLNCDRLILRTSKMCGSCSKIGRKLPETQKQKIGSGVAAYCKENRKKTIKICLDCPKPVSALCADRCWDCYLKSISVPQKYCIDCNVEVYKLAIRCNSCNQKHVWALGVKEGHPLAESTKQKISKTLEGHGFSEESLKKISESQKERLKDPRNHPMYIDGRSFFPYPEEFNQYLKDKIRARDNYECQNCKITEEEHLIIIGTNLHVHHIDYDKNNCQETNLITTCNQCNTRANGNRNYWQEFYQKKIKEMILSEL